MSEQDNLISVRSDVAASLLIDGLVEETVRRVGDPLPAAIDEVLQKSDDSRLSRLGYWARVVERERFVPARKPVAWLSDLLLDDAIASVSAALAQAEPLDKPSPADAPPSWRIPGPGGHVRHFMAMRAVGDGPMENKRSWMFGFFARCCEENETEPPGQPQQEGH